MCRSWSLLALKMSRVTHCIWKEQNSCQYINTLRNENGHILVPMYRTECRLVLGNVAMEILNKWWIIVERDRKKMFSHLDNHLSFSFFLYTSSLFKSSVESEETQRCIRNTWFCSIPCCSFISVKGWNITIKPLLMQRVYVRAHNLYKRFKRFDSFCGVRTCHAAPVAWLILLSPTRPHIHTQEKNVAASSFWLFLSITLWHSFSVTPMGLPRTAAHIHTSTSLYIEDL